MEKLKFIKVIWLTMIVAIVILVLVGGWFYWFQWRPGQIRKECVKKTIKMIQDEKEQGIDENAIGIIEEYYLLCIRDKGLEK